VQSGDVGGRMGTNVLCWMIQGLTRKMPRRVLRYALTGSKIE